MGEDVPKRSHRIHKAGCIEPVPKDGVTVLSGTAIGLSDVVKVVTLSLEGFTGHCGERGKPSSHSPSPPPSSASFSTPPLAP